MINLVAAASFYAFSVFCHPSFASNPNAIESCIAMVSAKSPHADKAACDADVNEGIRLFAQGGYTRMLEDKGASINFACEQSDKEPTDAYLIKKYGIIARDPA